MSKNIPLDRSIGVANKAMDFMATKWTDEKHRQYLNSMEALFVKQLYSSEHSSNILLSCLSRTQKHTKVSRLDPKNQPLGQFKVSRRGYGEKLEFERTKSREENENESNKLSVNSWIRHFRSHCMDKEPHLTLAGMMEGNNLVGWSARVMDGRHEKEATSSKQTSRCCSRKVQKVSIGSITEVSDQNFVDVEVEGGDETSRRWKKKRAGYVVSDITDQVVPFVVPTSNEKAAFRKEKCEEYSNKNLKKIKGSK